MATIDSKIDDRGWQRAQRKSRIWLEFLGSMELAVSLLAAAAIASVIGKVL